MSMMLVEPPRRPGPLVRRIRVWLGLDDIPNLVDGQRRDFDQLGKVLNEKDADATALRNQVAALDRLLGEAVGQLNRVSTGIGNVDDRLKHYERTVPAIAGAKRAYDGMVKREIKRRQALVEANPELSEAGRQFVMRTGQLPTAAAAASVPPAPATPVEG